MIDWSRDTWFMPVSSREWHLWKVDEWFSPCGLPYGEAAMSHHAQNEIPSVDVCRECRKDAT